MSSEKIKILLIEADPDAAKKFLGFLQEETPGGGSAWVEFEVTAEEDLNSAVSKFDPTAFDVIVLGDLSRDLEKAAADNISSDFSGTPVILFSQGPVSATPNNYYNLTPQAVLDINSVTAARLQRTILQALTGQEKPGGALRRDKQLQPSGSDELEILLSIAQLGADATTADELIDQATALIGRTLFPDNFGVLLLDEENKALVPHSSYYVAHSGATQQPIPLSRGVAGTVAVTMSPRRIDDVSQERAYLAVDSQTKSELCVPLIAGNRMLGVVNAESTDVGAFSQSDERFLTILGGQLATAIEKTRAFAAEQLQRQRAETLERVGLALSSTLELPELLKLICQESLTVYEADATLIWLVQNKSLVGYAAAGAGTESFFNQELPLDEDHHLPVEVIQNQKPIYIQSSTASGSHSFELFATDTPKSILGVPLIKGEQPIGSLFILNTDHPRAFNDGDIEFALALGSHAAVAIDNARLFEEERRRREEAEIVRQATAGMVSSLELTEVLDQILTHLEKVITCDSSCLFLIEEDRLHSVAGRNHPDPAAVVGRDYPLKDDLLSQEIINSRRYLIIDDTREDLRFKQWGGTAYARSWLGIPLLSRGRVIGILSLDCRKPGAFSEVEATLAQTIASHAAMAIEHARLFEETQRQALELGGLYETALTVSSVLVEDALLARVRDQVIQLLNPDSLGLFTYDERTDSFEISLAVEGGENVPGIVGKTIPVDKGGLTGWVIQSRSPLLIFDLLEESLPVSPLHFSSPARSWLGVPLVARDRLIGAITLQSYQPNAFNKSDRRYLESLAAQVAIALDNADLYETARQGITRQEAQNKIVFAAAQATDLQTLADEALDHTLRALGLKAGWLRIGDKIASREIPEKVLQAIFQRAQSIGSDIETVLERLISRDWQHPDRDDPLFSVSRMLTSIGLQSIMSVPFERDGRRIGGFTIVSRERRLWSDGDYTLVEAVGKQVSSALERIQLFDLSRSHSAFMDRLVPLSEALNRPFTVEEVLAEIGQGALSLSGAKKIAVFSRSPDDSVTCPWSHDLSPDYTQQVCAQAQNLPGGKLFHSLEPIFVPEINQIPVTSPIRQLAELEGFAAYGIWPLVHEERTIAAVGCYYIQPHHWSPAEEEVMKAFTRQAAVALKNAELFEKVKSDADKLGALYEIGKDITNTLDLEQLLNLIVLRAIQLTGADKSLLLLIDTVEKEVIQTVGRGFDPEQIDDISFDEVNQGLSGWVLENGEPAISRDLFKDPRNTGQALDRLKQESDPGRSIAVAPLFANSELIGTLSVINGEGKAALADKELDSVVMLASQAEIALQNAQLFSALEDRINEMSAIAALSAAMRGADSAQEISQQFANEVARLLHADTVILYLYDENNSRLVAFGIAGTLNAPLNVLPPARADKGEDPLISEEARELLVFDWELLKELGSGICVPLRTTGGEVMGVIITAWQQTGDGQAEPFGPKEDRLVSTLAELAANALQRARAHEELEGAYLQTVLSLAKAMDARDIYSNDHSQRMVEWAESVAVAFDCTKTEIQAIRWAALLHDIGKISVPDQILLKPGPLTDEEWLVMKRNPEIGAEIVAPVEKLADVVPLIRGHKEKFDGTGYPDGLAGNAIPLGARIMAVADAFSAMTDERVYRKALSFEAAIAELHRCAGTQFDPEVVTKFLQVLEKGQQS